MKTQKEIDEQIARLITIRPNIKSITFFGDSILDKLDAQVKMLEEDMDSADVWDEWPDEGDTEIRLSADDAINWRDGKLDEDLDVGWPLK